jgi:hypothetical protein
LTGTEDVIRQPLAEAVPTSIRLSPEIDLEASIIMMLVGHDIPLMYVSGWGVCKVTVRELVRLLIIFPVMCNK